MPTNKKNMYIYLSDEGLALKKNLVPLAENTSSVSIEGVTPDDLKTARQVLLTMIKNLARDELLQTQPVKHKTAASKRLPKDKDTSK